MHPVASPSTPTDRDPLPGAPMDPADHPAAFWDRAYGDAAYRYGTEPNAFLAEVASAWPPGRRVLVVGDGEGRNGVWLASQGHEVVTVDTSAVGVDKARALARRAGVSLEARHGVFPEAVPEREAYDAVVLIYVHVPPDLRPGFHRAAVERLVPGGRVVLEGFRPEQRSLGRTSGGPPAVPMLFTESDLRADFEALDLEHLSAPTVVLHEGPGHEGEAEVIRLVGRRRA